jgi:hypothetical protein
MKKWSKLMKNWSKLMKNGQNFEQQITLRERSQRVVFELCRPLDTYKSDPSVHMG